MTIAVFIDITVLWTYTCFISDTSKRRIITNQKKTKNRFQNLSNLMMLYFIAGDIGCIIVKVFGMDQQRVVYLQTNPQINRYFNHNNQWRSRIHYLRNALFDEEERCDTTCFSLSSNTCIALGWIYCVGDFSVVNKWHVIKKGETQFAASLVVFCLFCGAANRRGDLFVHSIIMYHTCGIFNLIESHWIILMY